MGNPIFNKGRCTFIYFSWNLRLPMARPIIITSVSKTKLNYRVAKYNRVRCIYNRNIRVIRESAKLL